MNASEPPDSTSADLDPPFEEPLAFEEEVLMSFRRIIRAVDLHSRQLMRAFNLTTPQLTCLRFLGRSGLTNIGEIARGVSLSQATLTGILDRLESRGLVERRRSTLDRRRVLVELTAAGREAVATLPVPLHERFARRLAKLPERKRQEIRRVLSQLESMMEATGIDAAPVLDLSPSLAEESSREHSSGDPGAPVAVLVPDLRQAAE